MTPEIPKPYIAPREHGLVQVYVRRIFPQTPYHETWLKGQQFEEITVTSADLDELLAKAKDRQQETAKLQQRQIEQKYG